MTTPVCKNAARRLLKCFCGCSEYTEEEIQRIYRLSSQATLIDRQATKLLRSFLLRSGDKSQTEQYLDIYEHCTKLALQEDSMLTLDELEELNELGLPYHMEKNLKSQIQTGDRANIIRGLLRVSGDCRNEIEASAEYKNFKEALLDKLNN